jgi:chaperonin GroEL (HSP60 family)
MAVSREVAHHASGVADRTHLVIEAFTDALEQIPGVLATNAGQDPIDTLTTLRSRHAAGDRTAGIAGTGEVCGMIDAGIVEPHAVFDRSLVIALEAASMILRIDEVVSTPSKETEQGDTTRAGGHSGPDSGGYPWAISH